MRYRQIESLTDYVLVSQNDRRVEQFTKQGDGTWRLVETAEDGTVSLETIGCTLTLDDVYNKVNLEPLLRLSEKPR